MLQACGPGIRVNSMGKTSTASQAGAGAQAAHPGKKSALPLIAAGVAAVVLLALAFAFIGAQQQPSASSAQPGGLQAGVEPASEPVASPDSHGCALAGGYAWCNSTQKCILASEENCPFYPLLRATSGGAPSFISPPMPPESPVAFPTNSQAAPDIATPGKNATPFLPSTGEPAPSGSSDSLPAPLLLGNDSDVHGCKASAGYSWCESTQKCYRPQDEGCQSSLSPSELVEQYNASNNSLLVGNDSDAHGCKASAGYSWCEPSQKCIRSWEENCTASALPTASPCTQLGGAIIDISDSCPNGNISPYPDLAVKNKTCCFAQ